MSDAQTAADPLVGRTVAGGRYTVTAVAAAKELAEDDAFVLKGAAAWDWRRALIENRPAMRELLQIYASKAR